MVSTNRYHRCTESVFTERSVLALIILILVLQLLQQGLTKHSVTLAMDEDNLLTFLVLILIERLAEHIELIVQNLGVTHACGSVEKFVSMEVDFQDTIVLRLTGIRLAGWL